MAERPAGERTEQPTPKRLEKARAEGQVAASGEVPSALMIAGLLVLVALTAPSLYGWFVAQMQQGLSARLEGPLDTAAATNVLTACGLSALAVLLPFFLAGAAVSVAGSVLVGGWAYSPRALRWNLSRLSPMTGLKDLFSAKSAIHLLASLLKVVVIVVIVRNYARSRLEELMALRWASPAGTLAVVGRIVLGLVGRIAIALVVIAGLDMLYQKWRHRRELKMTLQEVKEERRQYELNPLIKGRIRAVQIELVRRRMLQEVPKADVVLTNPTHVAVALRYDAKTMHAPQVVAKGADLVSEKIREIARAHGVPIVQRPELARTLYATVDLGEHVPETLFVAVAEVLAMIFRLRRKRLNMRT
jgi:flagellar biosynthetic protein FlhB